MKINEIVEPKPITLEVVGLKALGALFTSGNLGNYLNDRKVIAVGKKVAKHFQKHMKTVAQQAQQTYGASKKELDAQPAESLEKLGKIQLTEEEEQQIIEEVVLQELLPALAAIGSGLGAGARAVGSAVGAGAKAAGRAIGAGAKAVGRAGVAGAKAAGRAGVARAKAAGAAGVAGAKRAGSAIKKGIKQVGQDMATLAARKAADTPPKPGDIDGDGDADAKDNEDFQAYAKDFASNKVFMQNIDGLSNKNIKSAVDQTIKSMSPDDKNEEQWVKLVALSQQSSALDPTNMSRQQKDTRDQVWNTLTHAEKKGFITLTPAGKDMLAKQKG